MKKKAKNRKDENVQTEASRRDGGSPTITRNHRIGRIERKISQKERIRRGKKKAHGT